jgi:hypothetical protein
LQPSFSYDAFFGKDGSMLLAVVNAHDYENDHAFMLQHTNGELIHAMGANWLPFATHYGDIEVALTQFDKALQVIGRCMEEPDEALECNAIFNGLATQASLAVVCELPID